MNARYTHPIAKRLLDGVILLSASAAFNVANAQSGLAGSTYNGLWDIGTQPASISYSTNRLEFNVMKLSANVDNDFVHVSRLHLASFRLGDISTNGDLSAEAASRQGSRALDIDSRVLGPSLLMRFGRTSFAFTTGLRARMDVTGLEGLVRLLNDDALNIQLQENMRLGILRFGSRQLAWGEAGFTVAQRFPVSKDVRVHGAVSFKYLAGMHGAFIQNGAPTLTLNLGTQELRDVNIAYGMSDLQASSRGKLLQGSGFGVDAGVVLELFHHRRCGKEEARHLLRFGAAITDLGGISFGGKARSNAIINGRTTLLGFSELAIDDIASVDTALSHLLLGDAHASDQQRGLRMALPTALRTSIDWNVTGDLFLNVAGTFGLDRGLNSVREPNVVSLSPRYGSRKYEIALPVSLYRMKEPRVGMNLRVGSFMIGSDKVGALLGLTDFGGMDLYMGIRVAIKEG